MSRRERSSAHAPHTSDAALIAALEQLPVPALNAIWLGALLTLRLSDGKEAHHAVEIIGVLEAIRLRTLDGIVSFRVEEFSTEGTPHSVAHHLDLAALRHALVHEFKLNILYVDNKARSTTRIVWPLDLQNFGPNGAMLAWCEKRADFRNFRFDRIKRLSIEAKQFDAPRAVMVALYGCCLQESW